MLPALLALARPAHPARLRDVPAEPLQPNASLTTGPAARGRIPARCSPPRLDPLARRGRARARPADVHMYGLTLLVGDPRRDLAHGRPLEAASAATPTSSSASPSGASPRGRRRARLPRPHLWNEVPSPKWKGAVRGLGGRSRRLGRDPPRRRSSARWIVRRAGATRARFMIDAVAPGLLLAQAIGRIGNWWNQELYGKPTDLPWGLEIDPAHRPAHTSATRPSTRRSSTS